MKTKIVKYFLLPVSILLTMCKYDSIRDIPEVSLTRETVITQFSDSSYFSDIRSMNAYKNRIYLTDYRRNQIIILDEKGQLVESIGSEGRGPGEFQGAADLFITNDTLYVFNDAGRSFELFGLNCGHIKKINFPGDSRFFSGKRFVVKNGKIFISSPLQKTSIAAVGVDGVSYNAFGRIIEFDSDVQTRVQNSRHLVAKDNIIYAISTTLPFIEKYNTDGQLLSIHDFGSLKYVQKRLDFVKSQRVQANSSFILFADVYVSADKMYLLIVSNDSEKPNSNKVLVMDLSHNNIIPEKVYHLGEGWFRTITVINNSLWAFNSTQAGIIKYSIY